TVSSRRWWLWSPRRFLPAVPDRAAGVLCPAVRDPLDHRSDLRAARRQPSRAAWLALGAGYVPLRLARRARVPARARRWSAQRDESAPAASTGESDLATACHTRSRSELERHPRSSSLFC